MSIYDCVIRGGVVHDGTGAPPRTADVAMNDGLIVAVDPGLGSGRREIDADGALVMPGFVDIHCHYDGQATWDERLVPSSWHGVTTALVGNCGVGFAPVRAEHHEQLIEMMEGIEDIPDVTLHEGLAWDWESFPEFLDAIARRPHDVDVAAQVPHSPLRFYVMGERARAGVMARPDEIEEMGRLAADAVRAGALGFATSRSVNHKSSRGVPTPTLLASEEELVGIGRAIAAVGAGTLQVLSDFVELEEEFAMLRRVVAATGLPLSYSLAQLRRDPTRHTRLLALTADARKHGLRMTGQVAPRATGVVLGLDCTLNPFSANPEYKAIEHLPTSERARVMRSADLKAKMMAVGDQAVEGRAAGAHIRNFDLMFELRDPPDYEPSPDESIARRAAAQGRAAEDLCYDLLCAGDGSAMLYTFASNFEGGSLDAVREMITDPNTVIGLSDGGAHVGSICDASFPTTLLTLWGRDRPEGRVPLPHLIERQTRATAAMVGLEDRGVLAPGYRADVNVIDFDALLVRKPYVRYDLPAGGRRLLQRADGYLHTIVRGIETYAGGEATGELPGRLVRGPQPRPQG